MNQTLMAKLIVEDLLFHGMVSKVWWKEICFFLLIKSHETEIDKFVYFLFYTNLMFNLLKSKMKIRKGQ